MKKLIRKILSILGYDIHRINVNTSDELQLCKSLQFHEVNVVFDIGANIGQFASGIRKQGYKGRIVSFEPLSDAYNKLKEASKSDNNWILHEQCAIGDFDGDIEINISGNSVSSSVLPMLEAHSSVAKDSQYVSSEKVSIYKLDSVVSQYLNEKSRYFIKIDTQGFEWQVLDGASETLENAQGVLCEMSLVSLYEGQRLWKDVLKRLEQSGFKLWAIQRGFTDPDTGRSLQVDAIFYRKQI